MRKTIKIVGVGDRRQGTSKNGKHYDFTPIHFCYTQPWISGYAASFSNVSQDILDDSDYVPSVNDEKEVVMHQDYKSGAVYIDAIL